MTTSRTRRVELEAHPEDKPITRVQIKFTKAALERLFSEHVELETIIGHQAIATIIERFGERLLMTITDHVSAGLDLKGGHIAQSVLGDRVREMICTEVGNYVRCQEHQIRSWIQEEIQKQVPVEIKHAVTAALKRAAERVLNG